jgi:hypothetical protein
MKDYLSKGLLSFGLLLVLVTWQSSASADADFSSLKTQIEALVSQGHHAEALVLLAAEQPNYPQNPEYDYLLGVTALSAEENTLALNALERVVMMQPSFAGAWVDLAIAYYRLGDLDTAMQVTRHVSENFDPPPKLQSQLALLRQKIEQARITNGWRVSVMGLYGHVKNANYGLSASSFELTPLGGAPVEVVVAGDSKPKSSSAYELRADAYRVFSHENQAKSEVQLIARQRSYVQVGDQDILDAGAYWVISKPIKKDLEGLGGLNVRHLTIDHQSVATYAGLMTGIKTNVGGCSVSGRLEVERRMLQGSGQYDATVPWLGGALSCPYQHFVMDAQYRYGWDNPDGDRAGGATMRQEASLQARWNYSNSLQVRGVLYYAHYADEEGYSALLDHDAKRRIHRLGQRVELDWWLPFEANRGWALHVEADHVENDANLAIARFKDTQVFMGLRYQLF